MLMCLQIVLRIVIGYQGNTNALKLVASGNDGLEGLTDELDDGKVLYALLRRKEQKGTK